MSSLLWSALDGLIAQATRDADDVRNAREEYGERTGRVHNDHELYAERSDAFVEWYVLDRVAPGSGGRAPIALALAESHSTNTDTNAAPTGLRELRAAHHGLFRILSLRPGGLLLEDLVSGARFDVDERRRLVGMEPGDLFDTRLYPDPEAPYRVVLGRTALFHPREAAPAIERHIAAAQARSEPRFDTLARLLRLRLRALSYRHVSPARIYAWEDALP
jgi:hypothetical protein